MNLKEELRELCNVALINKNINDDKHRRRFAEEMREVDAKDQHEYFMDLYRRKVRYPKNPHNLLIPYLLGMVTSVNIYEGAECEYGELPDIDTDFASSEIRDYLKNDWAPKQFGIEKVCNVGSYNTFKIKSALIDIARVFDKDRSEILEITKRLPDKDDEGEDLEWDKALELYPELKAFCEANPDLAEAAQKMIGRNKSMGKHAGGLIISSVPIDNFVPIVLDSDGNPTSAWPEGLHSQDLSPVGLIKFDLLVVKSLMQSALAVKIIKERHKFNGFCVLPGQEDWDWSDLKYLEDSAALTLADKANLRCIFQFGKDGIRTMVKNGGVSTFDDIFTYTALYRPGPLDMKMHERFIARKRGKETYQISPSLESILRPTYGVLVFQEQVIKILHVVGGIPMKDCEGIRKAISKKKVKIFAKYKEMFLANGQVNLSWSLEEVQFLWDQICAFAEYGFNKSHAVAYSYLSQRLLYLKTHFPLEFFAATLSCEEKAEKIKESKVESENHGIKVHPIDINKSKVNFEIIDEPTPSIYIGFSNIKGIGEAVAKRIVESQHYANFDDFLTKFGTDATPIKPLIGLRAFKESEPATLYKYLEWYKDAKKKKEDRKKRFELGCERTLGELKVILPAEVGDAIGPAVYQSSFANSINEIFTAWEDKNGHNCDLDKAVAMKLEKYKKSCNLFHKKVSNDAEDAIPFNPKDVEIPEKLATVYNSIEESEKTFYGFVWTHPLEKSPDYNHLTFERFRNEDKIVDYVQVHILEAKRTLAKNKKTHYYLLKVEDSHSELNLVQVWENDWERFSDRLTQGALVWMKLQAPSQGFPGARYTLYSPPKHKRAYDLPKNPDFDNRVAVMQRAGVA